MLLFNAFDLRSWFYRYEPLSIIIVEKDLLSILLGDDNLSFHLEEGA